MHNLSLTKRLATIGGKIAGRTEIHGDDEVPALTIPMSGILLDEADIARLLDDVHAHSRLFRAGEQGFTEPAFQGVTLIFEEMFKGAKVTLKPERGGNAFVLKPATIKGIVLEPQMGGLTAMRCSIMGAPSDQDEVDVLHLLNSKVSISILNGKADGRDDAQAELPLGGAAPAGAPEEAPAQDGARVEGKIKRDAIEANIKRDIEAFAQRKKAKPNRKTRG